jgi:hypothetical protein
MKRFLTNLVRAIRQVGGRRPTPSGRRVCLNVETMEERMVPSSVQVMPGLNPAQTAAGHHHRHDPERCHCVHGYKWRPRPLAAQTTGGQAEGREIRIENGHLVVTPPEGPLPTAMLGSFANRLL